MNLAFPVLFPPLIDPSWFGADSPCDDDAELTRLEREHIEAKNSVGKQYSKNVPIGKGKPVPMEEESYNEEDEIYAEEVGNFVLIEPVDGPMRIIVNEESEESDESHGDEEEEDLETPYTPPSTLRNNNDLTPDSLDDITETLETDTSDQSTAWSGQ